MMPTLDLTPLISEMPAAPAEPGSDHGAARDLALGYQRYVSGCWRGDVPEPRFGQRLAAYWSNSMPYEPPDAPDAISPHGGGGKGIRWFQKRGEVLGFVPGARGGYRIPREAVPPMVHSTRACACTTSV